MGKECCLAKKEQGTFSFNESFFLFPFLVVRERDLKTSCDQYFNAVKFTTAGVSQNILRAYFNCIQLSRTSGYK